MDQPRLFVHHRFPNVDRALFTIDTSCARIIMQVIIVSGFNYFSEQFTGFI